MHLEDSILIDCPPHALFELVSDVEGHKDILPGYLESRIIDRKDDVVVLQRQAVIHGRMRRWTSEVVMHVNRGLQFRQLEGPLRGMEVRWDLLPKGKRTELRISHDVSVKPWWKKWWMEQVIAKPAIEKTARIVLDALKLAAEARVRV